MDNNSQEARKVFSLLGWSLSLMLLVTMFTQILVSLALGIVSKAIASPLMDKWVIWIITGLPFYLFGVPTFYFMTRKLPSGPKGEAKEMSLKKFLIVLLISLSAAYIFNIVGVIFNILIGAIKGNDVINPLIEIMEDASIPATLLVAGILTPIFEELVFRGIMLDKLRAYGDETAIWVTGLAFGLFHGNLSQFFYAFVLGLIFGYVAVKTNQIKYTVILHMIINILGTILIPALSLMGDKIGGAVALVFIITVIVSGIKLYYKYTNRIEFEAGIIEIDSSSRMKVVYYNLGMILFFILSLTMFIGTILS